MPRDPKYDVLFESVPIGPKTLKNRFYQAPHCTGFGDVFPGGQAYHRAMKAEGGWAAVTTEATTIGPEYDWAGQMTPSRLWDDADVRNWSLMADKVHEHDALAGIELHAGGAFITGFDSRQPARHVSDRLEEAAWLGAVVAMDKAAIREVQQLYVEAAQRALAAGFDIVNIWGGEAATLPIQFLMPLHNTRTDEYGGSLENRARFWLETLERVKQEVGDQCAIAARFCIDTLHDSDVGIRVEEDGVGFIELADHLVDLWDVQVGGETVELWIKDAGPSRFYGENFQGEWVAKIRPATRKPIIGVGRFINPDTMVAVIRSRQLDVIGAARPTIADPFLPRKIEEGRLDEIRECIGCNVCVSRINAGWHLICTQNATAGEEFRRGWHPERFSRARNADRDVLVVGAGPAGMECAITLGKRGMRRVHLVDAERDVGGHIRWVGALPGMGDWNKIVNYRKIQIDKLANVEVVLKTRLGADDVVEYGADIVIVAIGARWCGDGTNGFTHRPLPGADAALPHVLTPEQLLVEGKSVPGPRVVVYDAEGYFMGVSIAEKLARDGHSVTLVTPLGDAGPYMRYTGESVHMTPMLQELGVVVASGVVLDSVADGVAHGRAEAVGVEHSWPFDAVVLTTQRIANGALYAEVTGAGEGLADAGVEAVYRIGDCLSPRQQVADAIFDGHRLAREIDTSDPSVPLPWIRERRVVGAGEEIYTLPSADAR
ncbi:MAG TPA: NAD(P)-binding protein [Gaiellaceae bacterium]|nr:NAD(P)-binding protein [Gaiellaceae bacterium]